MNVQTALYLIVSYAGTLLLLGGAAAVLFRALRTGENAKALYALSFTMLMWGLVYLTSNLVPSEILPDRFQPMSLFTLIGGNLFVIICLLYPLEVLRPGWISARHIAQLMTPYLIVTLAYFLVLALLGQSPRRVNSVAELLSYMGEFNIWYRFVLYLTVCVYIVCLLVNTNIRALDIRHRSSGSVPPLDRRVRLWLRIYGTGMAFITIAYLCVMLYGSLTSLIFHRLTVVIFFTAIACSVLFDRTGSNTEISDAA